MITSSSVVIFVITLIGAEVTLLLDAKATGLDAINFIMILKMIGLATTQGLAWLTLSPKFQPLGKETKENTPGN